MTRPNRWTRRIGWRKKAYNRLISNWQANVPVCVEGLVLSGDTLFMAGSPRIDRGMIYELLEKQKVDRFRADTLSATVRRQPPRR